MKFALYFMGESYYIPYKFTIDCLGIARKIRDTYNCNVELVAYGYKRVKVFSFKKRETYFPYSRERLERNGTLY